jgi:hypothetical protein
MVINKQNVYKPTLYVQNMTDDIIVKSYDLWTLSKDVHYTEVVRKGLFKKRLVTESQTRTEYLRETRIRITKEILDKLKKIFGDNINVPDIKNKDLEEKIARLELPEKCLTLTRYDGREIGMIDFCSKKTYVEGGEDHFTGGYIQSHYDYRPTVTLTLFGQPIPPEHYNKLKLMI